MCLICENIAINELQIDFDIKFHVYLYCSSVTVNETRYLTLKFVILNRFG